ncbi:hypothetical protein DH2020_038515 [Rehmannia glutinosa]|uniref:Uncharacterized protein n=1 Tax=Rehmannia glutinosa TaxID=99300 RepID=A0ABR0UZH7_REHGL
MSSVWIRSRRSESNSLIGVLGWVIRSSRLRYGTLLAKKDLSHHKFILQGARRLVVYDITRRPTFESLRKWLKELREFGSPEMVVVLVGNKSDLAQSREVNLEDGQSLAQLEQVSFMETSAKENLNVEEAFLQMITRIYEITCHKSLEAKIDHQAAESLGKNEKPPSDDQLGSNNGVSKSFESSVDVENSTSVDSDDKASSVGDATPRTQAPSRQAVEVNMIKETVLHPSDDSDNFSRKMSISHEKELDMKVGLNDGERLKREFSAGNISTLGSRTSSSVKKVSSSPSDRESNSETDSTLSSDSESEREREERRKRRQQILAAERAAAKAIEAIKERENLVAKLEEKQSLEKILEERAKQQVQEASELQTTMMETMEAVELEKQKHNNTRMEALTRLAKLEVFWLCFNFTSSANADLTRSLASVQKNLEVEVDRIAELRQQIHIKEATHEELRRKISSTHQDDGKLRAPKGVEFELEMLEAEYSFINDKVGRMQDQAKTLETSIETTRREIENPTEVEIELKRRLHQLTDHLIQKQAQVETLSSEKAMLLLRIEAVSRLLDEYEPMIDSADFPGTSSRDDLESGVWQFSNSKFRSLFKGECNQASDIWDHWFDNWTHSFVSVLCFFKKFNS